MFIVAAGIKKVVGYHVLIHIVAPFSAIITEVVVNNVVTCTYYADGGPGNTHHLMGLYCPVSVPT